MFLTLIAFIFTLSILVFAHELGHFFMARRSGIKVEEFGFGLPPRIWGKKIGETIYSINLFPVGGFVKLFGEERDGRQEIGDRKKKLQAIESSRAFWAKSKLVRVKVVVAGVVMNILLAITAFWLIYLTSGIPVKTDKVMVVGVVEGSPAAKAGMMVDDVITGVEGKKVKSIDGFIEIVEENKGREIEVVVNRHSELDSESISMKLASRELHPEGEGSLGVVISQTELKIFPIWQMPFLALKESIKEAFGWVVAVGGGVIQMIWQLVRSGRVPEDIAGPVGIFQITGMVARQGIYSILQFLGILSINLAVINILPFPPLDGGKLLFIGIEGIFKKKVTPKVERWVQNIGVILFLILFVLITIKDVVRLLSSQQLF